jgi:hypothetical protein
VRWGSVSGTARSPSNLPGMRVAVLVLVAGCSFVQPPGGRTLPRTSCSIAPPFVDVAITIAGIVAIGYVFNAIDNDPAEDEPGILKLYAGGVIAVPTAPFLASAIYGFIKHSKCQPSEPPPIESGRRCVPLERDPSLWTCGEGFRCTADFAGCEPSEGTVLRPR